MNNLTLVSYLLLCITTSLALWTTDNYAMNFDNDSTFGAYNCGNSPDFDLSTELTLEAWIKPSWDSTASSAWSCKRFFP